MRTTTTPKYITVRDDILHKIRSGQLQSGERIASRREICEKYNISNMTAYKVQTELQKTGLVKVIAGQGLFINNMKISKPVTNEQVKLEKVCIIGAKFAIGPQTVFGHRLIEGLKQQCDKAGLDFSVQYIDVSIPPTGILRNDYDIAPNEGLVFFMHSMLLPEIISLLLAPEIKTVCISNFFIGSPAVLVDNSHGMHEIFNYVESKGCKKIFYASRFTLSMSQLNENERLECFNKEMSNRKLTGKAVTSGNFNDLLDIVEREQPDAVLFSADTPALTFRRIAKQRLKKIPLLVGFDNISEKESGLESLSTYEINCKKMGVAAVELLQEFENCNGIPFNRRIPGKILIR